MSGDLARITPSERPDYRSLVSPVSEAAWPEFMFHDPIGNAHWDGLFDRFGSYQFALVDRETGFVAGIANSVPLVWDRPLEDLPDEGWDWALVKSAEDHAAGRTANLLCAIQISVAPSYRGTGLSGRFVGEMIDLARSHGLRGLVAPVRPNWKDRYPLTSIDRYLTWTLPGGLPFDPWLRVHVRRGGRILKPCHAAMRVVGSLAEWQEWTGLQFFESGETIVPGALVPVTIDRTADRGIYVEPNVWTVHPIRQG